jgi:hypothetical protein
MTSPRITYAPRHDTASKGELDALVAIYRRAIERFEDTKKGAPESALDDVRKDQDAHTATHKYSG